MAQTKGPFRPNQFGSDTLSIASLSLFAAASCSSISVMQIAYALAFFSWLGGLVWTRGRRGWHASALLEPMLAFLLANIVALLFSVDPGASLNGIKQLALLGLVLVVGNVVTNQRQVKLLLITWLIAAVVASVYAGIQCAQGEARARAFFGGPMTLARILLLAVIVAITLAVCGHGRIRKYAAVCSIPLAAGLYLTLTRSTWLALLAAMLFLGAIKRDRLVLGSLAVSVCVAVLAVVLWPHSTAGRLARSIVRPLDPASARFHKSTHQRYQMWQTALRIFPRYPLTGVGQRNFGRVYSEYVPQPQADPYVLRGDGTIHTGFSHAHNLYLNLLVTQGIIGLGTFLWLILAAATLSYRTWKSGRDRFARALALAILTALVGYLTLGLFDENSRDSEGILQVWFLLGLIYALPRLPPESVPCAAAQSTADPS
jgi:O-antigen ligase